MAKHQAGERKIILNGREYVLRPSYEALMEAEELSGRGILETFNAFRSKTDRTKDTVSLIFACLKEALSEGETVPAFNTVARWIYEANVVQVRTVAQELAASILLHGREIEEKKSEVTEKP